MLATALWADDARPKNQLVDALDFSKDSLIAKEKNQTIVVMFSADHCPYCEIMREEILQPMQIVQKDSNYMIRHVEVAGSDDIIDFDGKKITMDAFSSKHKAYLTPTLAFFDHKGRETKNAPRIIGVYTVEMLGYYVDSSIDVVSKRIAKETKMGKNTAALSPSVN